MSNSCNPPSDKRQEGKNQPCTSLVAARPVSKLPAGVPLTEEASTSLGPTRSYCGLPLLSLAEFQALYKIDSVPGEVRTFDFQGYVEIEPGVYRYADVLATNGLRGGIHVGIDGTTSYYDFQGKWSMTNHTDVREYDIYITIPPEVQKAEGVLCRGDSCISASQFREELNDLDPAEFEQKLDESRDLDGGWVVVRLIMDPQVPGARDALRMLNLAITHYITKELPLDKLKDFIDGAESHIQSNTTMARPETLLEEDLDKFWERFTRACGR